MNKEFASILKQVEKKEPRFIRKLLVFRSPVTHCLEYRVAYFTDTPESMEWENSMNTAYKKLGVIFNIYTEFLHKEGSVSVY